MARTGIMGSAGGAPSPHPARTDVLPCVPCAETRLATHDPVGSVVDLFCGGGALSHGFLLEGFLVACGFDIDETCRFPFEENNSAPFVRRDVTDLDPDQIAGEFVTGLPRVLIGCAPCQPFSRYSQRHQDPKWRLLRDFARLVVEVQPDVVTMENVPQLLRFRAGRVFADFVAQLRECGYIVRWTVAHCPDFGIPQHRSRLVVVASKLGDPILPTPTHPASQHLTVADAIGHMPPLSAGQTDLVDRIHCSSGLSELNLARIRASRPGGTWRDWPEYLVAQCHRRVTGHTYSSVYGRMEWSRLSPTITTQFYGFGNGRFGHPEQDRALSLREGAILQSFPGTYKFVRPGSPILLSRVGRIIGNAVPVLLARAVARSIRTHIEDCSP